MRLSVLKHRHTSIDQQPGEATAVPFPSDCSFPPLSRSVLSPQRHILLLSNNECSVVKPELEFDSIIMEKTGCCEYIDSYRISFN